MTQSVKSAEDLYFTKDHQMVRQAVRDFVNKEINPYIDEWEEQRIVPLKKLFKKMGKLGFLGIRYDPQYGGQGLDYCYETVFLEELGRIKGLGLAVAITVQTNMATPAIDEFGSEYLKENFLKTAIAGQKTVIKAIKTATCFIKGSPHGRNPHTTQGDIKYNQN